MYEMDLNNQHINAIQFESDAQLFSGMSCWPTSVLALSLQGVKLSQPFDQEVAVGDIFRINIPFKGARAIAMSIEITAVEGKIMEARWTQIDMESFAILKRTIELNSRSKNQVRDEIKTLSTSTIN